MYVRTHQAVSDAGHEDGTGLADRVEVIDALYRFGLGQDLHDAELFGSAFTATATLDFRPCAARLGIASELMAGRDAIVSTILPLFEGRVDTTHVVTNPRVDVAGDRARLTAIVEAQHLLAEDHTVFALLKNLYDVELERDGRRWLISAMVIDNVWYRGDPRPIFGG